MYFIQGLLCGLKQLNPKGGWLTHDPVRGWEIETPALHDEHCKILLQDDLTFVDGKVVEIEKYIEHYKKDKTSRKIIKELNKFNIFEMEAKKFYDILI